jgi:hypothetical protein
MCIRFCEEIFEIFHARDLNERQSSLFGRLQIRKQIICYFIIIIYLTAIGF